MTAPPTARSIRFRLDQNAVNGFAEFSGDRSALHVDERFARRSMYRRTVAHGVLPLLLLSQLPVGDAGARRLRRISARFLKPAHPGDEVVLRAWHEEGAPQSGETVRFVLEQARNGTCLTEGSCELELLQSDIPDAPASQPAPLLIDPVGEAEHRLEDIKKGSEDRLRFAVGAPQVAGLRALVGQVGAGAQGFAFHPRPLLGLCAVSTLVGMRLPGRHATLTGLDLTFPSIEPADSGALLSARVSLVSSSTSTIATEVHARTDGGQVFFEGTLNARVNEPPLRGLSLQELKARKVGLDFNGKVVLITGASRGIGALAAKLFALHGARVAINCAVTVEEAEQVRKEIEAEGGAAIVCQADVGNREAVGEMVRKVQERLGPVEVLVNSAGPDTNPIAFTKLSWSDMERDLDVVLKGAFHCTQAVLPAMIERGRGAIVNVSTTFTEAPPPEQTRYVVAKSALVGLTRSLAVELAPHGIRVNLVAPSFALTDLTRDVPKILLREKKSPMGRLASAEEIAQAIVVLASDLLPFTSGQQIVLAGGAPPF